MKHKDFLEYIQRYYNKYDDFIFVHVEKYIKQFTEEQLEILYKQIIEDYPSSFKIAPDVALLNKAKIKARIGLIEDKHGNVYLDGKLIGHYDESRFIPEPGQPELQQIPEETKYMGKELSKVFNELIRSKELKK